MDFRIIKYANLFLEKYKKNAVWKVFVSQKRGAISPAIKIYNVQLFYCLASQEPRLKKEFTVGGVLSKEEAEDQIEGKLIEYFLENGV